MKKGFTLIELLAVIIVLAIIALVATPIVLDVIKDSRDSAAKDSAIGVLNSANYYYAEEYMKNNGSFSEYECSFNNGSGCDLLSISGDKPISGSLSINKDGRVNGKIEFNDYIFYICNSKILEEESSECSFIEYEKIYTINEEGIITGFKTEEVASILDFVIPTVNATSLTTEADEYIKDGKITIPEYINNIEVTGIADNAFNSYEITEITILSSKVITIGENAFPNTLSKLRVNSCLIDKYNLDVTVEGFGTCETTPQVTYKCKRATTLHTETCGRTSNFCYSDGYYSSGSKGTKTITYGNLGTSGVLTNGDAFDCDVDGDGQYGECDLETGKCAERFYYVSGIAGDENSEYAVLIYYSNTKDGVASNSNLSYHTSNSSYYGPTNAILSLPTITQWNNVSLSNTIRDIADEKGNVRVSKFSYEGYSARLLTYQEVQAGCNSTPNGVGQLGISKCNFLLENTTYATYGLGTSGFWLENPQKNYSTSIWTTNSEKRLIFGVNAYPGGAGVRPAIEVLKTDIEI